MSTLDTIVKDYDKNIVLRDCQRESFEYLHDKKGDLLITTFGTTFETSTEIESLQGPTTLYGRLSKNVVSLVEMRTLPFTDKNKMNCELMLTYDTPALRQTGSRNLTGQKTLPTIWGTYMKLVTKYQISAINSC